MLASGNWHHRDFDIPPVHCVLRPTGATAEECDSVVSGVGDLKSGDVQPLPRKDRVCKLGPDEILPEE